MFISIQLSEMNRSLKVKIAYSKANKQFATNSVKEIKIRVP